MRAIWSGLTLRCTAWQPTGMTLAVLVAGAICVVPTVLLGVVSSGARPSARAAAANSSRVACSVRRFSLHLLLLLP